MLRTATSPGDKAYLDIPQPLIARHPDAIISVRELRAWLSELPATNPRFTIHQLQRQLAFLVRDPRPNRRYDDLLRCYHEPVAVLQAQAWEALETPRLTRNHLQRELLEPFPGLLQELASAHMRAVQMRLSSGKRPDPTDVHAALLVLGRIIQHNTIEHQMLRPTIWRQMVQLHNVATRHELGGTTCKTPLRAPHESATADGAFFCALVLLLSDPYRRPVRCIQQLIRELPRAVDVLRLSPETSERYRIPIDLSGESTPLEFSRRTASDGAARKAYLHGLDAMLRKLPADDDTDERHPCRLRHWLATDLGGLVAGRRERRHPRQTRNADYHFIQGLQAIHQRLMELHSGRGRLEYTGDAPAGGTPCRQNDASIGGASFLLPARVPSPEPGEWLLFEFDRTPGHSAHNDFVAQMRRRLVDDNSYQYIGVERLGGKVIPVTLSSTRQPALFNIDPSQDRFQLIAPPGHFSMDGTTETLEGPDRHYTVRHEGRTAQCRDSEIIRVTLLD